MREAEIQKWYVEAVCIEPGYMYNRYINSMNSRHGLHSKMFRKFVHLSVKKVSIHLSLESLLLVWEVSA